MKRKGSVSIVMAVCAFAMLAISMMGVELARIYIVQERLQTALDAASIVAAREMSAVNNVGTCTGSCASDTTAIFWANFSSAHQANGLGPFQAVSTGPVITPQNASTITIQANVQLPLLFTKILGVSQIALSEHAQAVRSNMGMELALVLDNTDSLEAQGIEDLQCGAKILVDTVYGVAAPGSCGGGTGADTVPNLWVSIVPFAGEMNIFGSTYGGPSNWQSMPSGWLTAGSDISTTRYGSNGWMGCVMARYSGYNNSPAHIYDVNDANPIQAPFTPFYWPSTYHKYSQSSWFGGTSWVVGDNDWILSGGVVTPSSAARSLYGQMAESPLITSFPTTSGSLVTESGLQVGPNLGCDPSPTLPETASRSVVEAHISSMPMMSRGGTMLPQALQAGWFTISPNWQGFWPNPALPLAYNTPNMTKVLVLMTDGNNQICPCFPVYNYYGPVAPPQSNGDTDMVAYGRLLQDELGVVSSYNGNGYYGSNGFSSNILPEMNSLVSTVCDNIKNSGITIYVILYTHEGEEADATTQAMLQNCASKPGNYYDAPTAASMKQAFSDLGGQLSALRISQ
ncbi:TadE/TadG family type IV pilus assembly protein [Gluconacetobacter diazotrophicus]|uniref:VWA domain-containing protein n=2 Tax=Gluconacetobacter diazotrophicus TaxID=33996 RepID=A0A7W4FE43_GLUDI|nr:VWA domain-containing protein [Gluconacetobacter diazotrophicus]MBB2156028.1 VWA domain-containing protein [Gluconacetobacter diazotrophicus]TWB10405.1 putative Flp pilus-assembly TadE/G-like protein [Gluconacetobacter diazotrophicus]